MQNSTSQQQIKPAFTISEDDSSLDGSFQSNSNTYDVCFHLINNQDESVQSEFVNAQDNLSLDECFTLIQEKIKKAMTKAVFKNNLQGQALPGSTLLSQCVNSSDTDLYIFYEAIKPVIKEADKQIHYQTIHTYSYLDDKKHVKVYIPIQGIGAHPADKIKSRFLDKSFQIKIHDFNGKNWIFAVQKTQCSILAKESKVIQKKDKLIVNLGKMAQADNWFSLHKIRCVGEKDMD